jgi:hypothetical protein
MTTQRASSGWWARFTFNGITRYELGTYDLVGGVAEGFCAAVELSDAEREELLQLCRQRLDAFREQRGEESPAPKAAANAAAPAVAQQTPHQRALEVDHTIPKNHGGTGDLSNLQALCFRCNAAKRWSVGCVFCALGGSGRVLLENELALCVADAYPVSERHSLVIPRRQVTSTTLDSSVKDPSGFGCRRLPLPRAASSCWSKEMCCCRSRADWARWP